MLEHLSVRGVALLFDAGLKSLLLLALAGGTALLMRRASAAGRHLVWRLALCGLLALPLLSVALPIWPVTVWPRSASVTDDAPVTAAQDQDVPGGPPAPNAGATAPKGGAGTDSPPLTPPLGAVAPALGAGGISKAGGPPPTHPLPWQVWAFGLWAGGALLTLLPSWIGLAGVRRMTRRCDRFTDGSLPTLTASLAAELGVKRPITLLQGDTATPMTWGWRRPVVLLPVGADVWPPDRLRAVLLHELAHVARGDWPAQMLSQGACALYWFNPAVWLAAREARIESERACDDRVLLAGVPAPDYARYLLDVARALNGVPLPAALPMVRASQIESRLRSILRHSKRQAMLTRKTVTVAVLATAAIIAPLAALRPVAQAGTSHTAQVNTLSTSAGDDPPLPGGVQVTLAGVTEAGPSSASALAKPWWGPSGNVLPVPLLRRINGGNARIGSQIPMEYRALAFKIFSPDAVPVTLEFQPTHSTGYSSIGSWPGKFGGSMPGTEAQIDAAQKGYRLLYVAYPAGTGQDNIRVGVGAGPWETTVSDENLRVGWSKSVGGQPTYIFGPVTKMDKGSVVTLSIDTNGLPPETSSDVRVVAVDRAGREHLPVDVGDNSAGMLDQINARFALPPSAIKSVRLETRPFHWVTFRNVPLRPRS